MMGVNKEDGMLLKRLVLLAIVTGCIAVMVVSGWYGLAHDWPALDAAWRHRVEISGTGDLRSITIAKSDEVAQRINVFADGTWIVLGAILAAIGAHGLCLMPPRAKEV